MSTKPRKLMVISVCSECGKPVGATKNDIAYRHGFNRYVQATMTTNSGISSTKRCQEDGKRCEGSGKPVVYKRWVK